VSHRLLATIGFCVCLAAARPVHAQEATSARDSSSADISTERWRIGMSVTAAGGPCSRLVGTTTVPMDWPEQRVKVVKEDLSPGVTVSYKTHGTAAKQMVVKIARLGDGEEAHAIITFEVRRRTQLPPDKTDRFTAPDAKSLKGNMRDYLSPSPYIESTHPRIKALAKEVGADRTKAWEQVRAIYDYVRSKIQYEKDAPLTGVIEALDKGTGDCNELTSAFIALCRARGIPARTVRVPGHCYPEFYLCDEDGAGHWFPCQASGTEAFGGIPQRDMILQKGDNFRVSAADPATHRLKIDNHRFLPETLMGLPGGKVGGQPRLKLVCERSE
jgi:hypothetical protein